MSGEIIFNKVGNLKYQLGVKPRVDWKF